MLINLITLIIKNLKSEFKFKNYNIYHNIIMTETDKLSSLEEAISYPAYNEIKGLTTINVDEFNYESIKEKLLGQGTETIEGEKLALIDEMIRLLADNKKRFHIDDHNYIGLYWRGLPILIITINDNKNNQTMMYIAVKTYKDEYNKRAMTKFGSKIAFGALGVTVAGGLLYLYKSISD